MNYNIKNGQKSQTQIAKIDGQLIVCNRFVGWEFLTVFLMKCNMLLMPIALFPMIGWISGDKIHHLISKFVWFEQQQLNNIETDLCFVSLLRSNCLRKIIFEFLERKKNSLNFWTRKKRRKANSIHKNIGQLEFLIFSKLIPLTKHKTRRSSVTTLYFHIKLLTASISLLIVLFCPDIVNSKAR